MFILPHYHHLTHVAAISRHHRSHRIYCSATIPPTSMPKVEKLVIKTTPLITPPKIDDPSLKSTWAHRAWVAAGSTTVLLSLANCIIGSINSHIWLEPVLSGLVGHCLADLATGVYHWGIDNYGDSSTPLFGSQCDMTMGHHKWPSTIYKRQFANNMHALARGVTFLVLPINMVFHNQPVVMGFVATASACIMLSQLFHAWAHGPRSKLPPVVVALQDAGVLVSGPKHALHHRPPYNSTYCIVSGVWNRVLDEHKVFQALEMVVLCKFGLRPRSWSEPNSDWIEEAEASPTTSQP